jgi:quercetin dioxygenase-like cupin family protein
MVAIAVFYAAQDGIAAKHHYESDLVFPPSPGQGDAHAVAEVVTPGRSMTKENTAMTSLTTFRGAASRAALFAGLLAGAASMSSVGFAGECPADKMKADARQPVGLPAVGVTDTTLGSIDLGKEPAKLRDRELRFRKLTIEPGGVVPWHSHGDRPALIYVAEGEIHEFASNCAAPIVHKAGDLRRETSEVSHWWKNLGDTTVILLVADVLHDRTDHNM